MKSKVSQLSFVSSVKTYKPNSTLLSEARERAQTYGTAPLSNLEVLALLLGFDSAPFYETFKDLKTLCQATVAELASIQGVGIAGACRVKAALELGRRVLLVQQGQPYQITSPADAANYLMLDMAVLEQEHLVVLCLDTKNHVRATVTVYVGNVNTSIVRTAEILRPALRHNCPAIIVVHNHPSGDPTPSPVIWRKSQIGELPLVV